MLIILAEVKWNSEGGRGSIMKICFTDMCVWGGGGGGGDLFCMS